MNDISINHLITGLFEQFADWRDGMAMMASGKKLDADVGMAFCFQISISNHGYENDGSTYHEEWERHFYRAIHVIILSGRRVYIAETNNNHLDQVSPDEFVNTSNHDSCWRSDGLSMINQIMRKGYQECYDHVPEEHRDSPREASMFNQIGEGLSGHKAVKFVRVRRGPYIDNYHDSLMEIKELKMQVIVEEE